MYRVQEVYASGYTLDIVTTDDKERALHVAETLWNRHGGTYRVLDADGAVYAEYES